MKVWHSGIQIEFSSHNFQEVVLLLLQYNADTSISNSEGQTALVLARNPEVKRVIEGELAHLWTNKGIIISITVE